MVEITDEKLNELKADSYHIALRLENFEPYPLIVYVLPEQALLVESLRPDVNRPHLLFETEMRFEFDDWLADLRGKPAIPPEAPKPHSEYFDLYDLIEQPEFPQNLPQDLLKALGRKRLKLDFSRESIDALAEVLLRRPDESLDDTEVGLSALYVLESVRRAVGGTWVRDRNIFSHDLAIQTPNGRILDFSVDLILNLSKWNGYRMVEIYDQQTTRI